VCIRVEAIVNMATNKMRHSYLSDSSMPL